MRGRGRRKRRRKRGRIGIYPSFTPVFPILIIASTFPSRRRNYLLAPPHYLHLLLFILVYSLDLLPFYLPILCDYFFSFPFKISLPSCPSFTISLVRVLHICIFMCVNFPLSFLLIFLRVNISSLLPPLSPFFFHFYAVYSF